MQLSAITDAGHAWAERQHEAGVESTWRATWQEAVRLGLVEDDKGHELAKHCAAAARSRFRELRPGAPRQGGIKRGRRGGRVAEHTAQIPLRLSPELKSRIEAAADAEGCEQAEWIREACELRLKLNS